ncbi:MAG: NAD-dependent epimerase/dehydratase family protein [Jatrophihabitans sp.]|nr:MAG: NAD-dependent epimerase/dehydratase family protein [Jatrophihabitans sp.]
MAHVVLVTGVSRYLGGRLAQQLTEDPTVERIIGVDLVPPDAAGAARLGRTEFVRADIRNPLIAKVFTQAGVQTVVHAAEGADNLTGTMQLLSACQRSDAVERVVVRSTTAVYGSGPGDPAVFTEQMPARAGATSRFTRDAVEIENHVRGFGRRRPDVAVSILRLANLIGPSIDTALTRFLSMPVVPTSLGFDPRLQLLHESDAVEVLRRATVEHHPGLFNVAADGALSLTQAIRRAGRLRLPVPARALALVGELVRNVGVGQFSAEQSSFLNFGRVVDTTRLRTGFGYQPRYSSAEALRSYLQDRPPAPRPVAGLLRSLERAL